MEKYIYLKRLLSNKMKFKYFIIFLTGIMFVACDAKKERPAFYDNGDGTEVYNNEVSADYGQMTEADVISIPFSERNGVKYVNVSVNGFGFEMIFDTGCSGTLISVAEANYLYQKGYLTKDDILGIGQSRLWRLCEVALTRGSSSQPRPTLPTTGRYGLDNAQQCIVSHTSQWRFYSYHRR